MQPLCPVSSIELDGYPDEHRCGYRMCLLLFELPIVSAVVRVDVAALHRPRGSRWLGSVCGGDSCVPALPCFRFASAGAGKQRAQAWRKMYRSNTTKNLVSILTPAEIAREVTKMAAASQPVTSIAPGTASTAPQASPSTSLDERSDSLSTLSSSLSVVLQIASTALYRLSSTQHIQINPDIPTHTHAAQGADGLIAPAQIREDVKEMTEDLMERVKWMKDEIGRLDAERKEEEHVSTARPVEIC